MAKATAMATKLLLLLLLLILMMGGGSVQKMAAEAATAAKAPAPAPAPEQPPDWHNLTQVLVSAGYLREFVNLVATETKVAEQWQSFINVSNTTGATIFAPLDVAFQNKQVQSLLANLSAQNLTTLLLYHSLPIFHSYKDLQLSSFDLNPTFATLSHGDGSFLLNITNDNGDVTFHSSITDGNVSSNYYNDFPLSIFAIDQILVPTEIFGADTHLLLSPAPSPSPSLSSKNSKAKAPSSSMAFPRLQTPPPLFLALLSFFCFYSMIADSISF